MDYLTQLAIVMLRKLATEMEGGNVRAVSVMFLKDEETEVFTQSFDIAQVNRG